MTANVWRRSIVGLAIMLAPGFSVAQNKPPKAADSMYAELAKVPKKAAARTNPFESDAEAPIAGAKLYAQHCGVCHGENAGRKEGAKPSRFRGATSHAGNPLLAADKRRRSKRHAGLVQVTRCSTLAVGDVHKVPGDGFLKLIP